jgi:7-cyano-7-deazaguanine synthase
MALKTVILLSGGVDSTVNLRKALLETEPVLALTFDYGQKAVSREIEAASAMCVRTGVPHRVIPLPWLGEITATALVSDDRELPRPAPEDLDRAEASADRAAAVWVPNRNGIFVAVGAAFAESLGAHAVVGGFNAEEGRAFPDNSPEFLSAANGLLRFSTLARIKVLSYTATLDKAAVVKLGAELGAPLDLVWSCYGPGPEPCGECESCLRLARARKAAGLGKGFDRRADDHG